jgi:Phage head-tail joining protein
MMIGRDPGSFDHLISFYSPTLSKDSIGDTVKSFSLQAGSVRAQRVYKSSSETIEAEQQVGNLVQEFRIMDVRSQYSVTQQWEFTVYSIHDTALVKRYKIRSIEPEGRKNFLKITGELKDNY